MNLLAQYLGQGQPGLLGQLQQYGVVPFNPAPPPQIPMAQPPQIAPISPLMPGQPSNVQPAPGGIGPQTQPLASMGDGGFGPTMLNGMFGPPGSSAAPLGQNAGLGSMIAKNLLKMFL